MRHKYERPDLYQLELVVCSGRAFKGCSLSGEIAHPAGVRMTVTSVVAPPADP